MVRARDRRVVPVDLAVWKEGAVLDVEVSHGTTVGELVDALPRFLGLPLNGPSGDPLAYALRLEDVRQTPSEPIPLLTEQQVLQLESPGAAEHAMGPPAVLSDGLARRVHELIDNEIEHWLDEGHTLVMGAVTQARDEIRARITRRVADVVPDLGATWRTFFGTQRALRRVAPSRAVEEYQRAVRTGLQRASRSLGGMRRIVALTGSGVGSAGAAGIATATAALAVVAVSGALVADNMLDDEGANPDPPVAGETDDAGATPASGRWYVGSSEPGDDLGASGDHYVAGDGQVWERTEDWGRTGVMLRGPTGDRGPAGDPGRTGDPGPAGAAWSVSSADPNDVEVSPEEAQVGDFNFDACDGVVYLREPGEWVALVDLAGTQGPRPIPECMPTIVQADQTLWSIVEDRCPGLGGNRQIARAVAETWVASLDVIGGDPSQIDPGQSLIVRCE